MQNNQISILLPDSIQIISYECTPSKEYLKVTFGNDLINSNIELNEYVKAVYLRDTFVADVKGISIAENYFIKENIRINIRSSWRSNQAFLKKFHENLLKNVNFKKCDKNIDFTNINSRKYLRPFPVHTYFFKIEHNFSYSMYTIVEKDIKYRITEFSGTNNNRDSLSTNEREKNIEFFLRNRFEGRKTKKNVMDINMEPHEIVYESEGIYHYLKCVKRTSSKDILLQADYFVEDFNYDTAESDFMAFIAEMINY